MKLRTSFIALAAIFVLLLSACGPADRSPGQENLGEVEAEYRALLVDLEAGGAQVEEVGVIDQPSIGTQGRQVSINGFPVQVIIFEDEQARLSVQDQLASQPNLIPETGGLDDTSGQVWIWGEGRLMVIHSGTNMGVIEPLNDTLGEPDLILESGAVG